MKKRTMLGALTLCSAAGYVAYVSRWAFALGETVFYTKKLKRGQSIRLLHLSDIHAATVQPDFWTLLESVSVDMVCITGDMLLNHVREITNHEAGIRRLAGRVPTFFAEGNHDILYANVLQHWLKKMGVTPLYNAAVVQLVNGLALSITGLRDYRMLRQSGFNVLPKLLGNLDKNSFNIVMVHQPQIFNRIQSYGADLILAGHTHGGQVRVPILGALYAPGQGVFPKLASGWYKYMHISSGVGVTHFPIRFLSRSGATVINIMGL